MPGFLIVLRIAGCAMAGLIAGMAIRCKQDADAWGVDFFEVFQDRIMRMLGLW